MREFLPDLETEVGGSSEKLSSAFGISAFSCAPRSRNEGRQLAATRDTGTTARVVLDDETRRRLTRQARSTTAPHRLVLRSRIILLLEKFASDRQVAKRLHVTPKTVRRWRERFTSGGCDALWHDAPGRGRKAVHRPDLERALAEHLWREQRGEIVPSVRELARALGIGLGSAHRLLMGARRAGKCSS